MFHPGENYFRLFKEPLPSGAVLRGSGRPPLTPEKSAEYEKADEGSVLSMGYGIAFHKEAADTGITSALTEAPGPDRAMQALAVASFCAGNRERDLSLLSKFTEHSLCFTGAPVDARRACELFASVTPAERAVFFDAWMASAEERAEEQTGGMGNAASFSTTSHRCHPAPESLSRWQGGTAATVGLLSRLTPVSSWTEPRASLFTARGMTAP